jgi:hypothetical protein
MSRGTIVLELKSGSYPPDVLGLAANEIAELASCDTEVIGDNICCTLKAKSEQTNIVEIADRFRKALDRINIEIFLLSGAPMPF